MKADKPKQALEDQDAENVNTDEEAAKEEELDELLKEPTEEEVTEAKETPKVSEEEVAKPERKKKEEETVEERIYTIPLSKAWISPPKKRSPRAMHIIEGFVTKHMKLNVKVDEEEEEETKKLVITNEVNEKIWDRGIEKPPRKIRVRVAKDKEGKVTVYLAEGE